MPTLQEQIAARWGRFGDWNAADQDQTSALASILAANGVDDLGKLTFQDYSYNTGGQQLTGDAGGDGYAVDPQTVRQIQALYDGKPLGFLGNVEGDGAVTPMGSNWQDGQAVNRGNAGAIAWNGQGHGNTSFVPFKMQDGSYGLAPVWGSSSQQTYDDLRGIASILTLAAGGYYAGAGGTTGAVANGALQGYGTAVAGNMIANPDGDVNSLTKASLAGAATGAVSGGIKAYGADQGWSKATTKAVQGGANAAMRGGDGSDILKGAALSGAQSYLGGGTGAGTGTSTNGQGLDLGGAKSMDFNFDPNFDYSGGGTNFDLGGWNADGTDNGQFDFSNINLNGGDQFSFTDGSLNDYLNNGTQSGGLWKTIASALGGNGKGGGMGSLLPMLLGAGLGAAGGRDQQTTQERAPWSPMQPYIKGLAADGADLYAKYKAQPFSQAQQTAYANQGSLLDSLNQATPGLLQAMQMTAGGQNQFVRGRQQNPVATYGWSGLNWQPGLLGNFGTKG